MVKRLSVATAARARDRRKILVSMRDLLAESLDSGGVAAKDLPPLTRRLQDIMREIDVLDAERRAARDEAAKRTVVFDASSV